MKRLILTYLLLLFIVNLNAQDSLSVSNRTMRPSDTAYDDGNFRLSIELLEKEKDTQLPLGLESADLYYNLGNAYFRINEFGKARLYYERALLLAPGDHDIRHNIDYVTTKIEDRIPIANTFFLNIWIQAIQNLLSSDGWAKCAIAAFISFILCLFIFFFGRLVMLKKIAFYLGIILIILTITGNIFSMSQKNKIIHRNTAIIMVGSASIVSSPNINSKEMVVLHSGTKVYIIKEDRSWLEIEMENGVVGWIQRDKLEII